MALDFEPASYGSVYLTDNVIVPGIECPWCDWSIPVDEALHNHKCENCGNGFVVATAKLNQYAVDTKDDAEVFDRVNVYAVDAEDAIKMAKQELGFDEDKELDTEVERINE